MHLDRMFIIKNSMEYRLRKAIFNEKLYMEYQPIISLKHQRLLVLRAWLGGMMKSMGGFLRSYLLVLQRKLIFTNM